MPKIARLKIELDQVRPRVMRRVEVPLSIVLDDLHVVIQIAFGWWNYHLYAFRVGPTTWLIRTPTATTRP